MSDHSLSDDRKYSNHFDQIYMDSLTNRNERIEKQQQSPNIFKHSATFKQKNINHGQKNMQRTMIEQKSVNDSDQEEKNGKFKFKRLSFNIVSPMKNSPHSIIKLTLNQRRHSEYGQIAQQQQQQQGIDIKSNKQLTRRFTFVDFLSISNNSEKNNTTSKKESLLFELFFVRTIQAINYINKELILNDFQLQLKYLPKLELQDQVCQYTQGIHEQLCDLVSAMSFYKLFFLKDNIYFSLVMLILGIIESNSTIFISYLLYNIIEYHDNQNLNGAYLFAGILAILSLISIIARQYQYLQLSKYGGKLRQTIIYIIYGKLTELSSCSLQKAKQNYVLNIISGDLSYLESQYGYLYCLPIVPISLICCGYILWDKFDGAYGLMAIVVCIITYPIQAILQKLIQFQIKKVKQQQDSRLKQQSTFVENIQTLKMYCWIEQYYKLIMNIRQQEWKQYLLIQFLTLLDRSVNQSINIWGSFVFLVIVYSLGVQLTLSNIVLTIQLMGSIRYYCVHQVSYGLKAIINLNVIFNRIYDLLLIEPVFAKVINQQYQESNDCLTGKDQSQFSLIHNPNKSFIQTDIPRPQSASVVLDFPICMRSLFAYWDENEQPVLKNINISISKGQLISIVGKTGSGKTTLLNLIMKEIPFITGSLVVESSLKIAYVDQNPFIMKGTIKENILFGKEYDSDLFSEVIHASNLITDFNDMQDKENTKIGEHGCTLSGGQKARISLARAFYQLADIYLLDDPLAAVDPIVAKQIFQNGIQNFLFHYQNQKNNTIPIVLIATHQLQYALQCEQIIILDDGYIKYQGKSALVADQFEVIFNIQPVTIEKQENKIKKKKYQFQRKSKLTDLKQKTMMDNQLQYFVGMFVMIIRLSKLVGLFKIILIIILNLLTELIRNIFYRLIIQYTNQEYINQYTWVIILIVVANFINNISKYSLISYSILSLNNKIFTSQMIALKNGTKSYFDKTPSSFIMNKLTIDLSICDNQMFSVIIDILEDGCQFFVSIITVAILQPYFFIPIILTLGLSFILFKNIKEVLQQAKTLDLQQRAPIIQLFSKFISGLIHYRITNQFQSEQKKLFQLSNNSFQANYFYHQTQKCFSQLIDLIAFIPKVIGTYLVLLFINDNYLFSQALILLQSFYSLNTLLRQFMEINGILISYDRLMQNQLIEQEKTKQQTQIVLPHAWPKSGKITMNNVSLSYESSMACVLKQINIEIKPNEKVAFIGRTGAGKSSIINALYRLTEIQDDGNIQIDGVDISKLQFNQLRQAFAILPQQPFIFDGTIKQNLDLENESTDRDIWKALYDVKLDNLVEQQKDLLQTNVMQLNLSTGQKQLLCLARVLLHKKKIVILDEASANLDILTDDFIQEIIRTKLMDCTIICIAHRLNTIADYDNIVVLNKGEIAEIGTGYDLLCKNGQDDKIMNDSIFAQLVNESGKKNSEQILEIVKNARVIKMIQQKYKQLV